MNLGPVSSDQTPQDYNAKRNLLSGDEYGLDFEHNDELVYSPPQLDK